MAQGPALQPRARTNDDLICGFPQGKGTGTPPALKEPLGVTQMVFGEGGDEKEKTPEPPDPDEESLTRL